MGLADDMKAITDAVQELVTINKHIAKENNQECICYKAEQHNSEEIAHIVYFDNTIGLKIEYDCVSESFLLNLNSSDGAEFKVKVKINYCPMCGRKLTKI